MRPLQLLAAAILVGAVGASCAGQTPKATPTTSAQIIDELELRVEAPGEIHVGDQVELRLVVTNPTESSIELFGSIPGYRYDFHITNEQGAEVWQSVKDIPRPRDSWTIPPGESTYDRVWTGLDDNSESVPPGDYSIKGNLLIWGSTFGLPGILMPESPPVDITILP